MQDSQRSDGKRRRVALHRHRTEIEQWVGKGRSDEWIADALGTTRSSIQSFRSRAGISRSRKGRPLKDVTDSTEGNDDGRPIAPGEDEADCSVFEGVLDQGEEGYGLWLDPSVADDPIFREGFAGVTDVSVSIERDRIVLEPAHEQDTSRQDHSRNADSAGLSDESTTAYGDERRMEAIEASGPGPAHPDSVATSSGEPGKVKFFDASRGFGFLIRPDGEEIFFHRSEIESGGELEAGEFVVYEPGMSQRGPAAKRVRAAT